MVMQSGASDPSLDKRSTSHSHVTEIDSTVDIVTPENIAFKYQVAGPFRRLCAFLVDAGAIIGGLILLGLLGLLLLGALAMLTARLFGPGALQDVLELVGSIFAAIYLVVWFTSYWFYGGLFETYWNGQTPGKWLFGIRTLSTSGQPITGMQAVLRNILRAVDAFPLLSPAILAGTFFEQEFFGGDVSSLESTSRYVVYPTFMLGLLSMMMTRRFQRIGDLVCDTMVVMEERSWLIGVARLEDPRTPQLAAMLPPKLQIGRSTMIALATYVERRRFFSLARRREIARHLAEPLLQRFGMPEDTSHDLLLCALYYRAFVDERDRDDRQAMTGSMNSARALPATGPSAQPDRQSLRSAGSRSDDEPAPSNIDPKNPNPENSPSNSSHSDSPPPDDGVTIITS